MSEIFDKEKNNKNPVPNAEDKENAYIETDRDNKNSKEDNKTYSQSNENKKENKEADEFLYRQKGEKGDAEEAPSNAYQGNQADYEAEKDQKKAQNDQEEIQRTSDILNKKAKRNRTLGIGLIAVIVAIAIAITTLGGLCGGYFIGKQLIHSHTVMLTDIDEFLHLRVTPGGLPLAHCLKGNAEAACKYLLRNVFLFSVKFDFLTELHDGVTSKIIWISAYPAFIIPEFR